jgi:hypothetical protein
VTQETAGTVAEAAKVHGVIVLPDKQRKNAPGAHKCDVPTVEAAQEAGYPHGTIFKCTDTVDGKECGKRYRLHLPTTDTKWQLIREVAKKGTAATTAAPTATPDAAPAPAPAGKK